MIQEKQFELYHPIHIYTVKAIISEKRVLIFHMNLLIVSAVKFSFYLFYFNVFLRPKVNMRVSLKLRLMLKLHNFDWLPEKSKSNDAITIFDLKLCGNVLQMKYAQLLNRNWKCEKLFTFTFALLFNIQYLLRYV